MTTSISRSTIAGSLGLQVAVILAVFLVLHEFSGLEVLFFYVIAVTCSSWVPWMAFTLFMIAAVGWSIARRTWIGLCVAHLAVFMCAGLPLILVETNVIAYCGP